MAESGKQMTSKEKREVARRDFLEKLHSQFVGKKPTKFEVEDAVSAECPAAFRIEFEDGSKMLIRVDGHDLWGVEMVVDEISIQTFESPQF